uniref:T cell receptor beta variable 15 n=1 Tax=Macaca mulatta TaxID=9544 RepID=A0A5F8ATE6_MACMU
MSPGLLHWMALCLLGTGHGDVMVIQNPRYQVTQLEKPVTLSCSQNLNHKVMYWYQQKPSQAPKLLFHYYDKDFNNEADTPDNFQSRRPNTSFCFLDIRSPGLEDAAVYLCASSKDTELQCCLPFVHKPHCFPDPGAFSRTSPPPPLTTIGSGFVNVNISSVDRVEYKPIKTIDSYAKNGKVVIHA